MEFTFTAATTAAASTQAGESPGVFTFGVVPEQQSIPPHSSVPGTHHVWAPEPVTPPNFAPLNSGPLSFGLPHHQPQPQPHPHPNSHEGLFHHQYKEDVESRQLNPGGRMSLKQERGVGDSKRWRSRLWNQIENRIKDTRASIQNSRRQGFMQEQPSITDTHRGGIGGGFDNIGGLRSEENHEPQLSEEEEQRIIAEEWEKFKAEHAAALLAELEGLSEREIEEFEQEMLQQRDDYDSSYDILLEQEQAEMQYAIDEYLRHQDMSSNSATSTPSSAIVNRIGSIEDQVVALLAGQTCFRCRSAPLQPLQGHNVPHTTGRGSAIQASTAAQEITCARCGYRLSKEALQYIGNVVHQHR
ncbi:hypothetical protein BGZ73_006486 [Actinomortierella ambigua]|nr:hypothetical protein BGZ73_006486 [Actinomortierella ambigua]